MPSTSTPETPDAEALTFATAAELKSFIATALTEVCFGAGPRADEPLETTVARYFHPDYVQTTDGEDLDYAGFIEHLRALRTRIASGGFDVLDAVREGDRIADRHVVTAVKHDGSALATEVYLFGRCAPDGRLLRVVEASRLLSGDQADADLARAR